MLLNGLTLIENYINETEEINLIDIINNQSWNTTLKRLTQHYGYNYNYKSTKINYISKLPIWLNPCISKILNDKYTSERPDQIIINRYLPGEGISAHIDIPTIFKNKIYSLSLGSGCTMIFINKYNNEIKNIYIPPKTLLIMEDDARYKYTHSIKSMKYDIVNNNKIDRKTRYSITFRNIIL
tara:strand:+ start:836 stop:1381 length:546 start_codon:yes stop_codon:yes gene_type:complete